MTKLKAFILILVLSPILAGIYGILHDQLTYIISEEYYTKFKFEQFGMWWLGENMGTGEAPEIIPINPLFGVALVGFLATWWVGLLIGIVLAIVGLKHKDGKQMFRTTLQAIKICIAITFISGLAGLVYGKLLLVKNPPNWFLPKNLIHRDAFIMVGSMHNFSYLGGMIGLIIGVVYSLKESRRILPRF